MSEIHVIDSVGDVEVWLDTELQDCDGLCIGHAHTRTVALEAAIEELRARISDLEALRTT